MAPQPYGVDSVQLSTASHLCTQVMIYPASSLNAIAGIILFKLIAANVVLPYTSCEYLRTFCVQFSASVSYPNFNLVFPYLE